MKKSIPNNNLTLIIPDVHNRIEWVERAIATFNPNLTILLGDYFHSFDDDKIARTETTARWLLESLKNPNRIYLLGNHDFCHTFGGIYPQCGGWTKRKQEIIDRIIPNSIFSLFKSSNSKIFLHQFKS